MVSISCMRLRAVNCRIKVQSPGLPVIAIGANGYSLGTAGNCRRV